MSSSCHTFNHLVIFLSSFRHLFVIFSIIHHVIFGVTCSYSPGQDPFEIFMPYFHSSCHRLVIFSIILSSSCHLSFHHVVIGVTSSYSPEQDLLEIFMSYFHSSCHLLVIFSTILSSSCHLSNHHVIFGVTSLTCSYSPGQDPSEMLILAPDSSRNFLMFSPR